jgi:DNA segregation ATPase FtsK/SpoIIIE-like protein
MPPAQTPAFDPNQLLTAISGLKEDLVKEMDTRFASYDEKLSKVDDVSNILTEAQKAQQEEIKRRQAAQQAQNPYAPQTYQQIRDDAVKLAMEEMKREQAAERAKQRREQEQMTQEERELDEQLDRDMDSLERAGYLPKRSNPNDYNDPGETARRELLSRAAYLETPNLAAIADELTQMHRNNVIWSAEKKSWESAENTLHPLPGKYAPVGNSSTTSGSPSFSGPTARELRTMSMSQLAAMAPQRGYGPAPATSSAELGF